MDMQLYTVSSLSPFSFQPLRDRVIQFLNMGAAFRDFFIVDKTNENSGREVFIAG